MRISDWSSDVCSSDLPPFFYADGDDAINYGGIGAVIGHEAGHGFDDKGSQFDGAGNNVNWWTKEDRAHFEARADKLVAQFDGYEPLADHPDKHVNGKQIGRASCGAKESQYGEFTGCARSLKK